MCKIGAHLLAQFAQMCYIYITIKTNDMIEKTQISMLLKKEYKIKTLTYNVSEDIKLITKMFEKEGINVTYIGSSDTNGYSIYFRYKSVKIRFSNHSTTNIDRMFNEIHFRTSYRVDRMSPFFQSMNEVKAL